jgi:hypothetical protein
MSGTEGSIGYLNLALQYPNKNVFRKLPGEFQLQGARFD